MKVQSFPKAWGKGLNDGEHVARCSLHSNLLMAFRHALLSWFRLVKNKFLLVAALTFGSCSTSIIVGGRTKRMIGGNMTKLVM